MGVLASGSGKGKSVGGVHPHLPGLSVRSVTKRDPAKKGL